MIWRSVLCPPKVAFCARATGWLLLILANAKLLQLGTEPEMFDFSDPLFPFLSVGHSHLIASIVELRCALLCLVSRSARVRAGALIVLGSAFASYSASYVVLGLRKPCACLGILESAFKFNHLMSSLVTGAIVIWLLALGFAGIIGSESAIKHTRSRES